MRPNLLVALVFVLLAVGCVLLAYNTPADDVVFRSLALSGLASLITGLLFAIVAFPSERRADSLLSQTEDLYESLAQASQRFSGSWARLSPSAASSDDPNQFWMVDRFSPNECQTRLSIIGREHRTIFVDPTDREKEPLRKAIGRVAVAGERVRVFLPSEASTLTAVESFFRDSFSSEVLDNVDLVLLPSADTLHYSALINDAGAWIMPRLSVLSGDRSMRLDLLRAESKYYCELYEADLDTLATMHERVEW